MRPAFRFSVAFACALFAAPVSAQTLPPGFVASDVVTGLNQPSAVRFARDGRVFVAEQSGRLWVYPAITGGTRVSVADLRTSVHNFWDRGLLGLALDPDFPDAPFAYVLYTFDAGIGLPAPRWGAAGATGDGCPTPPGATNANGGCNVSGRLSRLRLLGDVAIEEKVLVEDWFQQFPSHSVGSIAFGDDGRLYATAGDGASFGFADWGQSANPAFPDTGSPTNEGGALRAQDLETSGDPVALNGALIRVDAATGAPVPGNPLFGTAASANAQRIVAYGLRNPFRMTVRAGRNEPWIGDVGWNTWEEVNRLPDVVAAAPTVPWNFGWPCYEGAGTMGDYAGRAICSTLVGGGGFSAHRPPFFAYNHAGQGSAVSGLAFHEPANWPAAWDNALFVADYSRARVYVLRDVDGNGDPDAPTAANCSGYPGSFACLDFAVGGGGNVDAQTGPGGDLYLVNRDSGRVRRVTFGANRAPSATLRLAPASSWQGPARSVTFDASSSVDPDGGAVTLAWDLDDDGAFDDPPDAGNGTLATVALTTEGARRVRVRASDASGAFDVATARVFARLAPFVARVDTVRARSEGALYDGARADAAITQLLVAFDEPMAASASDPSSYLLLLAGADQRFTTTACGVPQGDDQAVAIASATWTAASNTVALRAADARGFAGGRHRLLACASLTDVGGTPLATLDGMPGFALDFDVARGNRAANPNFDAALDGWTIAVTGGGIVTPSVVDAGDAATSGSVSFALPGTSTTSVRQCVAATPGDIALGEARSRSDGVDAAGLRMLVTLRAYGDAQCAGTALGAGSSAEIASGTAGAWRRLAPAALALPSGSVAVAIELRAETTGSPRTLRFDDAALVIAADALFANGLE